MNNIDKMLLDPEIVKDFRVGEKMQAIYNLRRAGYSWKDISSGFQMNRKQAEHMYGRIHEWIHFYNVKEEDIMAFSRTFGKFCEDRDVTRLISLMAMNGIHSLQELNEINLERRAINGIGERYTQVLKNVQTYLRNGAGYSRTIKAVISSYAYELLTQECKETKDTMGKVITRALLFYCGIEDKKEV